MASDLAESNAAWAVEVAPQPLMPWHEYRPTRSLCTPASCSRFAQLRWRRAAGASGYELDRRTGCASCSDCEGTLPVETLATTTFTWASSDTADGRGCWRVRAFDDSAQSPWSEWRSIRLNRVPDDINGDGYSDLVVRTRPPRDSEIEPVTEIWFGGPGGLTSERVLRIDVDMPPAVMVDAQILGDINGDGYDDVYTINAGYHLPRVGHLWFGSPDGLDPTPVDTPTFEGRDFTWNLQAESIGDLDGDGYDDAIPSDLSSAPPFVLRGSPAGLTLETVRPELPHASGPFGAVDVDADGFLDLVCTSSRERQYFLLFGGRRDVAFRRVAVAEFPDFGGYYRLTRVDDMDDDGFAELVGVGGLRMVSVIEGPVGSSSFLRHGARSARVGGEGMFGGDVDGDGRPELALRREYAASGRLTYDRAETVVYDADPTLESPVVQSKPRVLDPEGGALSDGTSMSRLLDFDGDGYADQVWFAKIADDDFRLILFAGSERGLAWSHVELYRYTPGTVRFGWVSRPYFGIP